MERISTRSQHHDTADSWVRMEADSLSDYTARPRILDICGELSGLNTLDLGCGEGNVSRALRRRGASVIAVDISEQMIARARQAERVHQLGFERTPSIEELTVTDEHLATDLSFFAPLAGVPLHLAFDVERT